MLNALTIDVEDYFQVSAFERDVDRNQWADYESRVVANTHRLLKLLDQHQVKATFFVLGWVAQHHPQLVRDIDVAGHEIGSHSYWHRLVYSLTPGQFREDLRRSIDVIGDVIGRKVTAFRAPSFSITKRSTWALDVLVEEGIRVDSSIFPIHHDRYGIPGAKRHLHVIQTQAGPLWQFPPSVLSVGGVNVPVSGGGYFRLYPLFVTRRCLQRINRKHRRPFMFYLHPWEIDPGQPRIGAGSRKSRLRHYVNLASTERKLTALLKKFHFAPMSDVIGQALPPGEFSLQGEAQPAELS